MRLIDADALLKQRTYMWDEALGTCPCVLVEDIENAPTVDAVVLPFKIGGDIWMLDDDNDNQPVCDKGAIKGAAIFEDGTIKLIDSCGEEFLPGKEYSCLSKEEAEELAEKLKNS